MKKTVVSIILAASMTLSMTGCGLTDYLNKVEEANQEQAAQQAEQQAITDAINAAINADNGSGDNGADNNSSDNNGTDDNSNSGDENPEQSNQTHEFCFSIDLDSADIYGNRAMTEDMIGDAKLVMINFWEPWCGPCVGELPDLEQLYENYKDQGLVIIGVYTTLDMPDELISLVEDNGITYPVIYVTEDIYGYMTEYVPTTCFFDYYGSPLEDATYIGAHDYETWAEIVESRLRGIDY